MSSSITITGASSVSGQSNQFATLIPEGNNFQNMKVGVSSLAIAYSWPNINSAVGVPLSLRTNGNFSYTWPNGAGSLTFTVTAPSNSFWEVSDLNAYLQSVMLANKTYLIDSNSNPVYYINIAVNSSRYAVQLNITPVPTSLPVGYTQPSSPGWSLPTGAAVTPQVIVPSPSGYNSGTFGSYIGFHAGSFPSAVQATDYSAISSFSPTVSPVSTILVTSNLCNNKLSPNRNLVYSFTPSNAQFGDYIVESPLNTAVYYDCVGQTNSVQLSFWDQNWNPLNILDPNSMTAILTFKPVRESNIL
jgi:hypothetical protein